MLVQAHPPRAGQEADATVEDVVAGEVNQGRAPLGPGNEEKIDAAPGRTWSEHGCATPDATVGVRKMCQAGLDVALALELGENGFGEDPSERGNGGAGSGDDEIYISRGSRAAAVGTANGDLDFGIGREECSADRIAVAFDFLAGDSGREVCVVLDAEQLVLRQRCVGGQVFQGPMTLLNPHRRLRMADSVDLEEQL